MGSPGRGSLLPCTLSSTLPAGSGLMTAPLSISGSDESQVLSPKCLFLGLLLFFVGFVLSSSPPLAVYAITYQPDGSWPGDTLAVLWPVRQPPVGSIVFPKPGSPSLLGISILVLCSSPSASIWVAGLPVALWGIISGASRFVRSVHILEVEELLTFVPFLGCEGCLLGDCPGLSSLRSGSAPCE